MDNIAMKRELCDAAERLGCWNAVDTHLKYKNLMNDAGLKNHVPQ